MQNLLILGAGGYGQTVRELALQLDMFDDIAFLDDNSNSAIGACVTYNNDEIKKRFSCAYPAFGNNTLRAEWLQKLAEAGYNVPTMIHPRAYISPSAVIGSGVVVLPNAVVNTHTVVENGTIINIGALIDHDCKIGKCCHIAPGAVIKANNNVPPLEKVESGTVLERK